MRVICRLRIFESFLLFALVSPSCGLGELSCSSHLDCPLNKSCCGNSCDPDHYCLRHSCHSNSDCGIYGSCCAGGKIGTKDRKCRKNCAYQDCYDENDCGRQEKCCNNKCTLHGRKNTSHDNTSFGSSCCSKKCALDNCNSNSYGTSNNCGTADSSFGGYGGVHIIIVAAIICICLFATCFYCYLYSRKLVKSQVVRRRQAGPSSCDTTTVNLSL